MRVDSLQAAIEAIPLASLAIDEDERIVAANVDAKTLLGQGIVGRNYVTMLRQPVVLDVVEATLRDGVARQATYLSNDGVQDTSFLVSCRLIRKLTPTSMRVVVLCFEDRTQFEKAGQIRRDFVANVSHELRTPLTALMGFIETLRGPAKGDPAAADRFLGIMQTEAGRMNRLIGDLLSLGRVESDERVRPTTKTELVGLLISISKSVHLLAESNGVEIETSFSKDRVEVVGDADQLTQVFTNLIENAIKYGASGGKITLRVTTNDREPVLRAPGVRVQVIDYGQGIDPVHLPRLTERFYRADNHRSRELGGTGLGLAIVKHIINRHRGRLRVESEVGKGATFTVILPLSE
ncbi:MAG: two-component sensor histidine kinase [Rhodobacteraceae bacterium]|nr:two-component sensor histidine kinase [Paracoccaceae bacterium]